MFAENNINNAKSKKKYQIAKIILNKDELKYLNCSTTDKLLYNFKKESINVSTKIEIVLVFLSLLFTIINMLFIT